MNTTDLIGLMRQEFQEICKDYLILREEAERLQSEKDRTRKRVESLQQMLSISGN